MKQIVFSYFFINEFTYNFSDPRCIKYYCPKCDTYHEKLNHKKNTHCSRCHSRMLRQCPKCGDRKMGYRSMLRHLKKDCLTGTKLVDCSICRKKFGSKFLLSEHRKICGKRFRFTCEYCSYVTTIRKNIQQHIRRHEKSENFNRELQLV